MSAAAIIVILVIVLTIAVLTFTRIAADAVLMAALFALLIVPVPTDTGWALGVLSPQQALSGFANTGMATVAVLFIVVAGLRETGAVDAIATRVLGRPKGLHRAVARMVLPVSAMSAFLNNTPIVAMMIPVISDWAKRLRIPASKLMIPLSYATILGGTCSLIGTSTNLVVSGMVDQEIERISEVASEDASVLADPNADLEPIGMFDITWIGLPSALLGGLYLIFVVPRLLPARGSATDVLSDPREYTLELLVPDGSALAGQTVEQAGLRNLPGCYLAEIERGEETMVGVDPQQVLRAGDRLRFAGVVDAIRDLQRLRGFAPASNQVFKLDSPRYRRRLFEAVISEANPVAGKTVREGRFRNRYQGVILAVARGAERLPGRIGDIELEPGDTLLIEAEAGFADRYRNTRDFLLVSPLEDSTPRRHTRAPVALSILALMVALATFGVLDMLVAAMLAAGLMILTRCCTISEGRRSVDWSVLVVIAAALGLGSALEASGAAEWIAHNLIGLAGDNPWWTLVVVYGITMITTEIITNNGAVALTFPIAYAASRELGVNFEPYIFAIMMAGSASFSTPIGYQTNLMVYGPGGYRFGDYFKAGIPLNLLMWLCAVTIIPLVWEF
jgi:di/tricarboxylate transporter